MTTGRIWALFVARNREFLRDRHALGWNLLFPFVIILGFAVIFSGRSASMYKVGLLGDRDQASTAARELLQSPYVTFVPYGGLDEALEKLSHHRLDMLLDLDRDRYWVNPSSPKGYVVERFFQNPKNAGVRRETVEGSEIRYVDWLLPGVLGMNVMFGCLFGVGYVIVRYRKNGVLKRFSATPLRPVEFLAAQVLSRFVMSMCATCIVFVGCKFAIGFEMTGSYLELLGVAALGTLSLISLGVLLAARTASEEFAGGLLNIVTWPMMFLSGVWFSLEGSPGIVKAIAQFLPLTHLIEAARAIMNEGKTLSALHYQIVVLAAMTALFLGLGSILFRWNDD